MAEVELDGSGVLGTDKGYDHKEFDLLRRLLKSLDMGFCVSMTSSRSDGR